MVPRRRPEPRLAPLALPLPAGRVPLRDLLAGERRARQARARSTSCSTPASSTTTATGSSRSTTPRPTRRLLMRIRVRNAGPEAATLHVLPTLWFRNDLVVGSAAAADACGRRGTDAAIAATHPTWATTSCSSAPAPGRRRPRRCCSARTRPTRAAVRRRPRHAVPQGRHQRPRGRRRAHRQPGRTGTKAAVVPVEVAAGRAAELRLRLRRGAGAGRPPLGTDFDARDGRSREAEADEFYADLARAGRHRRRGR